MDKAVDFVTKLDAFVSALNKAHSPKTFAIETGRKFDKVFPSGTSDGLYMIDRNSGVIYGIKSWAQHNPRREYGTLDMVDQFDWSGEVGVPKAGTDAATAHAAREAAFVAGYAKRGRPKKATVLP